MTRWCIITCEYPPIPGGVSDHTQIIVRAFAEAGDVVDVWCPPAPETEPVEDGDAIDGAAQTVELRVPLPNVSVHVLSSHFGIGAMRELRGMLRALPADTRVLVQWVPTAFGWRMMNVPFALLLFSRPGRTLDLYVHEAGWETSSRETVRRALVGVVHRAMTWLAARSARRVYVSIPAWEQRLSFAGIPALPREHTVTWVPIPSNFPVIAEATRVTAIRRELLRGTRRRWIVGHFGTFGRYHTGLLPYVVSRILDEGGDRVMMLVGRGGKALRDSLIEARPDLVGRVVATGELSPEEASAHLAACDLLVQPYDDGVSTRRSSLMAGIALGCPTITNRGPCTEDVWAAEHAVHLTDSPAPHALAGAVTKLLADDAMRARLGVAAARLHAERFALAHGVALLRAGAT